MSSDIATPNSEPMSNPTTFSYAQAAKGQSSTPSSQSNRVNGDSTQAVTATSTRAPSVAASSTSNEREVTRTSSVKPELSRPTHHDADTKSMSDRTVASSSTPESRISSRQGGYQSTVENELQSERRGRVGNPTQDVPSSSESKKSKKGRKGKAAEKELEALQEQDKKEPAPQKVELSEAPIPAVNPWTQRALAAKTKTAPSPFAQASSNNSNGPSASHMTSTAELKPKSSPNDGTDRAGGQYRPTAAPAKPVESHGSHFKGNGNPAPKKTSSKGIKNQDKEDLPSFEALEAVKENTTSWPTPVTAASERPRSNTEKAEKEDKEESGPNKPRQKNQWVHVPYVPTVKFETHIPTRAPRGGRAGGARGGRDATSGGAHHSNTTNAPDRSQDKDAGSRTRATSLTKRGPGEPLPSRDSRKPTAQIEISDVPAEPALNQKAETSKGPYVESEGAPSNHEASIRHSSLTQRPNDSIKYVEHVKDGGVQSTKDFSYSGQNGINHRSNDRPRGGGRGRGAYSNATSHHAQSSYAQNAPMYSYPTQSSRLPTHQYGVAYPQIPYNGGFTNTSVVHSANRRPGSISHRTQPSQGNGRPSNGRQSNSRTGPMPPVVIPQETGGFSNSGLPYYPADNIYQIVLQQVEYYFSDENLLKDWFLRKHMDSQGFVLLHLISGFKRMQALNVDYGYLRGVCADSASVELVVSADVQDRVRRRDGWEPFVYQDKEKRDISAQHDGVPIWQVINRQVVQPYHQPTMPSQYAIESPQYFSPTGVDPSFGHFPNGAHFGSPMTNGVNGHVRPSQSQLRAAVPEFSPSSSFGFTGEQHPKLGNGEYSKTPKPSESKEGSRTSEQGLLYQQNGALQVDQPVINGTSSDESGAH